MDSEQLIEELRRKRRRNLIDIIRRARWEAEMVKRLGAKWFEIRDRWLLEAYRADAEMWRNPAVRKAFRSYKGYG